MGSLDQPAGTCAQRLGNGGSITDAAGDAGNLTLLAPGSAGSLGANTNIVIDTTAPTVTGVTSTTPDGDYGVNAGIVVQVQFSKPVVVTGTPRLALNSGGSASYVGGGGSDQLTFLYTVAAGQNAPHLDEASASALSLGAATIFDTVDVNPNAAILTLPAPGSAGSLGADADIVIDTTAPLVTSYRVLFGNESFDLIDGVSRDLPWQITGVQAVFSEPIASGSARSLSGLTATSFTGLGTTTLTWTFAAITQGSFVTSLSGSGSSALEDAAGNPLGGGAGFASTFKVLYGDFNGDGVVSSADMGGVYAATAQPYDVFADLNGDGVVDINDVQIARGRIGSRL